jgi:hypothetical protein
VAIATAPPSAALLAGRRSRLAIATAPPSVALLAGRRSRLAIREKTVQSLP